MPVEIGGIGNPAGIGPVEQTVSQDEIQPWHRLGGMEHICELRKDATVLYAIFINILRGIYATRDGRTFGCPDVLWSRNSEKTQIWIDTELRWEDKRPDFLPAIYVNLGQMQYQEVGTMRHSVLGGANKFGETPHQVKASGTVNFMHVSNTAGEACAIADNTEMFFSRLRTELAKTYCFKGDLAVVARTPLQKGQDSESSGKKKFVSVVTVAFEFEDAWSVKQETPILKSIVMLSDEGAQKVDVSGSILEKSNGQFEVEFGNIATSTDTPLAEKG